MPKQIKLKKESFSESGRFAVALISTVCLIVYWQTTSFSFVWDDLRTHFVGNKDFRSGNFPGLWNKSYEGMYIPVSYSFWLVIYKLTGGVKIPLPFYMHLANILLHTINCLLVFALAKRVTKSNLSSLVAAIFFAVHPIQAETVSWVSEFRGLLSSCFMLAGMWLFYKTKSENKFNGISQVIVLLLGLMAMLSKPVAIIYPVLLLLIDYFVLKQFLRKNFYYYLILAACLIPFAVFTSQLQPTVTHEMQYPVWLRFLLPFFCLAFYMFKLFIPVSFCATYGYTPISLENSFLLLASTLLFSLLVIYYCYKRRRENRMLVFAVLFFMMGFLPVSGLLTFYFQQFSNVADRYLYLSLIGVALLIATEIRQATDLYKKSQIIPFVSVTMLLLAFLNVTAQKKWKDDVALWEDTSEKKPEQVRVWHNLGVAYLDQRNDLDKGLIAIDKALLIDPNYDKALMNKGNILARKGKLEEALIVFSRVIELRPDNSLAWYNRSLTLFQLKMFDKAQQDFNTAEKLGHKVNEDYRSALSKVKEYQNLKK